MKKITCYAIFLLLTVDIFCNGTEVKYIGSKGVIDDLKEDSILGAQMITEISISEEGDTIISYRYNKFDYGDISNHSSGRLENGSESAQPMVMSVSSEPVDQSKYVGKIPFTENVTPTGAKVYSVPIATASVNSSAPSLSITYNSQSGNGVAGYGWNIAGLSAISVANKSKYYDGNTSSVDLSNSANCAFSLDGVRLVPNTGDFADEYEYETAQGFILVKKYISGNNISYFTAKLPNGSTVQYGFTDNKSNHPIYPITEIMDMKGYKINFEYIISGNNYYISKIKYGGKNINNHLAEFDFAYNDRTDFTTGYIDGIGMSSDKLLKSIISYNNHNGTLQEIGTYTLTHEMANDVYRLTQLDYSIGSTYMNPLKFKYEYYDNNIPEMNKTIGLSLSQYFSNKPVFVRGKFIKDEFNDGVITFPGHYSIYTKIKVREVAGKPMYFEFGSQVPSDQVILIAPELSSSSQTKSILAESGFQTITAADCNGDGTDEILKINFNGISSDKSSAILKITTYKYIDNSFHQTSSLVSLAGVVNSGNYFYSPISRSYFWGDFLGNGKVQLLSISHCKDFMGDSRTSEYALIDVNNGSLLKTGNFLDVNFDTEKYVQAIDINGDGRTELCYITKTGTSVYTFSSTGYTKLFESTDLTRNNFPVSGIYGDLNGDGKMDILIPHGYPEYENREIPVWVPKQCLSCGREDPIIDRNSANCRYCHAYLKINNQCRVCHRELNNSASGTTSCSVHGITTMDRVMVSDGSTGNIWSEYLSTGNGFVRRDYPIVQNDLGSDYVLMDINNDGKADLVRTFYNKATVYINENGKICPENAIQLDIPERLKAVPVNLGSIGAPNGFICFDDAVANLFTYSQDHSKANLLTKLTDSFGAVYQTIYSEMTSGPIYTPSSPYKWSFPFSSIIAPINLVKNSFSSHNDIIYSYSYSGAAMHHEGLGFCGFEKVEVYNNLEMTTVVEKYDPQMFGLKTSVDTPEKTIEYRYSRNENENKKCNPQLYCSIEYSNLTDQEIWTSYEYDSWNNPISIRTDYATGETYPYQLINQTYSNTVSLSRYLIGLPLEKTVTNYTTSGSWTDKESITYNSNKYPISKITYTGLSGNLKTGEVRWEYDYNGNVISETSAPYSLTNFIGEIYTYDSTGRYLLTKTDALGLQTTYSDYDKFGNWTKATNHKSQQIVKTFDDFGVELTTTGIDGIIETISKEWGGIGLYTGTKSYNNNANPSEIVYYDALGREIRSGIKRFDGEWSYTDNQFDSRGRLYKTSMPFRGTEALLWNVYAYDNYKRPVSITEASGKTTTWSYNGLSSTETKDGISSTKTFDVKGQLIKVTDAGGEIGYTFRPDGQPLAVTVNNAIATEFEYDSYGRQISITDPSAGQITYNYSYEDDISVKSTTDARSKTITERVDRYGRLVSINRPEFNTTYTYDSDGQLTNETSTNQTSKVITYDELGRIGTITDNMPNGKFLLKEYKYNKNIGKVSSIKYTSQSGLLGTENYIYHYGYNSNINWGRTVIRDLREENDFGQPLRALTGGFTRRYTYDQYGMPTGRSVEKGDNILQNFAYGFDVVTGNLLSRTDVNRNITETFQYDDLKRLTGVGGNTITYANNGNILQKQGIGTLTYGNTNKPYQVTGLKPNAGYSIPTIPQDLGFTSFQRPAWIEEDADAASFEYNASHDRVKMSVYNQSIDVVTKYYSGNEYELHLPYGGSSKEILYLGGDAYSAPAVYVKEANTGKVYYICRDYLGSITHILNSDGTLKQELSYGAWGRLRNPDTQVVYASSNQPVLFLGRGYTGHEHLPLFGLINMNARLYDPVLGRFLSADPYVQMEDFTQNYNRYSYCLNNPLLYVDPNGEWFVIDDLIAAAAGFVCGYVVHGATTGNWGWKAIAAGGIGAGMAWLGYNTMGGSAAMMTGWQFAGNQVLNTALGMIAPPINFSVGDVDFSINPMMMFTAGAMGGVNGFSLGMGISASYDIGDWTLFAGIGPGSKYAGFSYNDKNFGFSWHTTKYSGGMDGSAKGQRTATLGFRYKDFSISHENDVALMGGDGKDRFRSAALELGYKDYVVGANVYTNEPQSDGLIEGTNQYKNGIQYSSPLYIGKKVGYGMIKVGVEHKAIGYAFQNGFHKLIGSPFFMKSTVAPYTPYIKSGSYNPYSKYY